MAWTPEQKEAIEKSGTNIIVSAGAGSGKTAVLSERVINKLKNGVHINELLILTFTKAAASEMKDRIRNKISMDDSLKDELDLVNSSYITTFDSYALSVVKKYHYLINAPSDISICDESIIMIEEKRILDELFEELYLENDPDFCNLIDNYCVKNDNYLRECILGVIRSISDRINSEEYLSFIENGFFDDNYLNNIMNEYKEFLNNKRRIIEMEFEKLNYYFDSETVDKFYDSINSLLNIDIEKLYLINKVSLPRINRYPSDESKVIKENFKKLVDDLVSYSEYGSFDDVKKSIISNRVLIKTIVRIVREFRNRINNYKSKNNIYTFSDIASMAISIVNNNSEVREELKSSFNEIMIDEYQDTNDIQEEFISLIQNNNVYMVGDIKQSIYKFRGSNPLLFKSKYDSYSIGKDGLKIDLIKNFRSRSEVLNNINRMFELLMDDYIGGCNYKESHEMIYGNKLYDDEVMKDFNYDMNILEYEKDENFSNIEIEMFTIANDIKNKIKSKMKVFDKKNNKLRSINYNDFVIILDRSKYFNEFKKVFEYLGIPLTILKDETLNTSVDILLIRNIFDFILRINNKDFGTEFKYDFMSIGRSFLYEYNDDYLFSLFINNGFEESKLYKDFSNIESINSKSISELFNEIIDITNYYSKIYKIGEYKSVNTRLNALYEISNNLNDLGYGIEEFISYLDNLNESGLDIKYNASSNEGLSVKIMTIHKSKGLEYPICYFADLDHSFNMSDSNSLFVVSNKYGLIVPNMMNDNDISILKKLYKNDYIRDEISERIRLFYVALTRAREKIIIVVPKKDVFKYEKDENGVIDRVRRLSFMKLSDLIYSIKEYLSEYFSDINLADLELSKNYLYVKKINNSIKKTDNRIDVKEININNEVIDTKSYSKELNKLINKETYKNMKYGTMIHEVLELIDLKKYNDSIIEDSFIRKKINSFMSNSIMKNIKKGNVYHEYEFMYENENNTYHGIIDLMIEYDDYIDIIDFKLSNISDSNYINQLNGYKNYINSISNKKVNTYLYSILDEELILIK